MLNTTSVHKSHEALPEYNSLNVRKAKNPIYWFRHNLVV